ncbi:MAG TPA: hypothetical protein DIS76_04450 [Rhodospirillaceae bacterium]|nr:hypothetical protein [Rhodospirillaceae bacterium]
MTRRRQKSVTHRDAGIGFAALALLLIALALPQAVVGWLTAPEHLDHMHRTPLTAERKAKFEQAMKILPQGDTANALSYAALNSPAATTIERARINQAAIAAVRISPGDPFNWYFLAAVLEPEIFEPTRMVLFDQALTMSMMTGPLERNLILSRALLVIKYWDRLSMPLRDDLEDQIFNLWVAAPWDLRGVYLALTPDGQRMIFDILEQAPGESIKFNQYLDNPSKLPQ